MPDGIDYLRRARKCVDPTIWEYQRDNWLSIPLRISPPGSRPRRTVAELSGFPEVAADARGLPQNEVAVKAVVDGIHSAVLHEAVFLLHKAWHVVGCAELHANAGYPTWSLSSGYHAAFFAAKSLIALAGFPLVPYQSGVVLLKMFPPRRGRMQPPIQEDLTIQVVALPHFQHRQVWHFYQRVLTQLRVGEQDWPSDTADYLRRVDVTTFTEERSAIHYRNSHWTYEDLHRTQIIADFGSADRVLRYAWEFPAGGRSLRIGALAFELAYCLLRSLCERSGNLRSELELFHSTCTAQRHPLFHSDLPSPA